MTLKSKIITTEIDKILQLMREIDPGGDYLEVYALLLKAKRELKGGAIVAHWIRPNEYEYPVCSNCGAKCLTSQDYECLSPFCPNCGAVMEGQA